MKLFEIRLNEGPGIGIGDLVKFHKPVKGYPYGQVNGFRMAKGASIDPKGLVQGKVAKIEITLKKSPYHTSDYGPLIELEKKDIIKVDDRYSEIEIFKASLFKPNEVVNLHGRMATTADSNTGKFKSFDTVSGKCLIDVNGKKYYFSTSDISKVK